MSHAMKLIVAGFTRLKDRQSLEDLMMHRRRLAMDLKATKGFDYKTTITQLDEDIFIIEAGLNSLSDSVAAWE